MEFIERRVWLNGDKVLKAVQRRRVEETIGEDSWDFSEVEDKEFTPEPDVLSVKTVIALVIRMFDRPLI